MEMMIRKTERSLVQSIFELTKRKETELDIARKYLIDTQIINENLQKRIESFESDKRKELAEVAKKYEHTIEEYKKKYG